jgi:hypothetical protein
MNTKTQTRAIIAAILIRATALFTGCAGAGYVSTGAYYPVTGYYETYPAYPAYQPYDYVVRKQEARDTYTEAAKWLYGAFARAA